MLNWILTVTITVVEGVITVGVGRIHLAERCGQGRGAEIHCRVVAATL